MGYWTELCGCRRSTRKHSALRGRIPFKTVQSWVIFLQMCGYNWYCYITSEMFTISFSVCSPNDDPCEKVHFSLHFYLPPLEHILNSAFIYLCLYFAAGPVNTWITILAPDSYDIKKNECNWTSEVQMHSACFMGDKSEARISGRCKHIKL